MPACAACGLYYTPSSLRADGTCPHCMQVVDWKRADRAAKGEVPAAARGGRKARGRNGNAAGGGHAGDAGDGDGDGDGAPPIPWHFKLLLAAAVLYLGFRAWQGVEWVAGLF